MKSWLTALGLLGFHAATFADACELEISVSGAAAGSGQIILSAFWSEQDFLKTPVINTSKPVDHAGSAVFELGNITPGRMAFSAIHDADEDGELDTGLFGIPTELVGFSRDARGLFGPPDFDDAVMDVACGDSISIRLDQADAEE